MKQNCIYSFRCAFLIVLSLLLVGCSKYIRSDALHQLQVGSPLSELSPLTFAIKEFVDVRGIDPQLIGPRIHVDQPVSKIITTAISKEFERNGHKVLLYSSESKAGYIIEGTIYKFFINGGLSGMGVEYIGNVAVKISISSASHSKVFVKKYEGEHSQIMKLHPSTATLTEILDQTQIRMIRDMSVDQELLTFLKK